MTVQSRPAAAPPPQPVATGRRSVVSAGEQFTAPQLQRRVLELAWPSVADNLLATMVGIVAMIMVGGLGSTAIAAVGISNQLVWLAYVVFLALGVGSTALVARAVGAGDITEANRVARQGMLLGCALSLITGAVGAIWAPTFLRMISDDPELVRMALPHMRISMCTTLLAAVSFGLSATLRGAGDMRSPMFANAAANVANVFLLYGFINGKLGMPRMGVAGAAVGASLARLISCAILLWVAGSGRCVIRLAVRDDWRPDLGLIRRIANVGMPSAMEQGLMTLGMLMFSKIVVGIGTAVYAAHQIGVNVAQLAFMPGQGFAMATTTLVGQSLGARRTDLAERFARTAQRIGGAMMVAMGVGFFLFGRQMAMLYTAEAEVIALAATVLRWSAFSQLPNSIYFIYAGALRGAGDTRWPLYISFAGIWGVRLNLSRFLINSLGWGIAGVWCAILCDMLVRAGVMTLRFRSGKWKAVRV